MITMLIYYLDAKTCSLRGIILSLGGIHKPRGQVGGGGISIVHVSPQGGRGVKDMVHMD